MEKPTMKVIYFDESDVIATSGNSFALSVSNLGDNDMSNNIIKTYDTSLQRGNLLSQLQNSVNSEITADTQLMYNGESGITLAGTIQDLINALTSGNADGFSNKINGNYTYDSTHKYFKQ